MLAPEILAAPVLFGSDQSHYNTFINYNRDPETRHDKLVRVVDPAVENPPHLGQPSHALLLAHWGDTNEIIAKVASWLYSTKGKTDRKTDQSIMVFREGSSAVLDGCEDFVSGLTIETGQIVTNENGLSHWFHGIAPAKPSAETNEPSARFMSQVSVVNRQVLTVDYLVNVKPVEEEGRITLYDGVVPLDADEYEAGRHTTVYPAAIGNLACFEMLQKLASKVSSGAANRFSEMFNASEVLPQRVLPDLSQIFQPARAYDESDLEALGV